jgi:hypothetical protein
MDENNIRFPSVKILEIISPEKEESVPNQNHSTDN